MMVAITTSDRPSEYLYCMIWATLPPCKDKQQQQQIIFKIDVTGKRQFVVWTGVARMLHLRCLRLHNMGNTPTLGGQTRTVERE